MEGLQSLQLRGLESARSSANSSPRASAGYPVTHFPAWSRSPWRRGPFKAQLTVWFPRSLLGTGARASPHRDICSRGWVGGYAVSPLRPGGGWGQSLGTRMLGLLSVISIPHSVEPTTAIHCAGLGKTWHVEAQPSRGSQATGAARPALV